MLQQILSSLDGLTALEQKEVLRVLMSKEDRLAKVKALLGINGTDQDEVLLFVVQTVEDLVLSYINQDTLPAPLENALIVMCVSYYKAAGLGTTQAAVGPVASVKRGDVTTSFANRLAEYIERRIVEDGYSPAAVLGEIKVKGIQFNTTICEATLYSYIKKGVFLTLEMVHLPCKGKQKRPYTKVKKNKKAARASAGKSIEKRDPEIDTREEVGHWEMDCVEGKKKTKETLLVLSERKARKEIMIKMKDQTAGSVVAALDRLERRYGTLFYKIFQTITVDNGSEFADVEGLERSCRRKGKRTTVFYCHPYSSYERGTNENINRMIRRWFPKGTDFGQVPKKAIQAVEDWLNAYPREILGFRSADEVFAEGLAALG